MRNKTICASLALLCVGYVANVAPAYWASAPWPEDSEITGVTQELISHQPEKIKLADEQIRRWVDGHVVPWNLWIEWFPNMLSRHEYQQIANLSVSAINSRPNPDVISLLLEWRIRALIALNEPTGALQAAKSYYNACDWNDSERAVRVVGLCLSLVHPGDKDISQRFTDEQALASRTVASNIAMTTAGNMGGEKDVLQSIVIDVAPFDVGLREWATHKDFWNRVNYANLLLVSDRAKDAEVVFRDLYSKASDQDSINAAYQGIARAIRAEDGNLGRANDWIRQMEKQEQGANGDRPVGR